jgi:hypothetical protein
VKTHRKCYWLVVDIYYFKTQTARRGLQLEPIIRHTSL